jgi:hypothetical protein
MTFEDVIKFVADELGVERDEVSVKIDGTTLHIMVDNIDPDDYDDADEDFDDDE